MVEVTQADRKLLVSILQALHAEADEYEAAEILNGDSDFTVPLQKIAVHRIAAEQAERERCAKVAEGWMQNSMLNGDCGTQDEQETGRRIAQAIRSQDKT